MITDEKRHEVAQKLRKQLSYMCQDDVYEKDLDALECGNRTYRNIAYSVEDYGNFNKGNYANIVELLADLIDRPTCEMTECSIDHGSCSWGMRCSHCGTEFEHEKPVYGWRYCPNCGAEVEDEV